jgi:hypothetical protein
MMKRPSSLVVFDWHALCLRHCVQKTKKFAGLFHLSTTSNCFCLITSLLILNATSTLAGEPASETAAELSSDVRLEKQTNPDQGDAFLLVRENLRSNRYVSVQAGYERVWDDESVLRKIASDRPEPGCAYIKASFSF